MVTRARTAVALSDLLAQRSFHVDLPSAALLNPTRAALTACSYWYYFRFAVDEVCGVSNEQHLLPGDKARQLRLPQIGSGTGEPTY